MRAKVENRGSSDLTDVRMDLNGGPSDFRDVASGWFHSTGFVYRLPELQAGTTVTVPWQAFQSMTGESFAGLPSSLTLTARLPSGQFGRYPTDF